MLTDTKIDVDLLGEIDEQKPSEQSSPGMSIPVPLNISQPVVKEWLAKKRANLRPLGTFFNTANFQVPPSAGRLTKRLPKNIEYFQSNYVLVFLVLVLYCLISSPLLLIVIAAAGGASYFASTKNTQRKLAIAGHEVSLAQQYGLIAVCSIPFFLWAGAGGIVFWVLGASMFFITGHAAFYNYDALDVPEDQEPLVGAIVEEV
eukprot:TRINITY_DN1741_c0_g1_i1.p1 TRINITY_DN1741_c0_g1~~TRINITY_DN1741_c0_g1_i1.p1  ORF type:complete len:203 (-),score=73.65 TRINITY_DN1741_c0_g1_i1:104-712(-)